MMTQQGASVVGVTGRAGSGKDTFAAVLVEQHQFQRVAFADALYEEVADAFDVSVSWLGTRETKEVPSALLNVATCNDPAFKVIMRRHIGMGDKLLAHSPRRILQLWGTEYRRTRNPSYWLDQVRDKVQAGFKQGQTKFVITDLRFENESEFVRAEYRRHHVCHVHRPGIAAVSAHASEVPVQHQHGDYQFHNDGTLEAFKDQVRGWALGVGL